MLQRFWVRGIRNLAEQRIELSPTVTIVTGVNNQGKTNFLEGIYFSIAGKPIPGESVSDLCAFGENAGSIGIDWYSEGRQNRLYRTLGASLSAMLDGVSISQSTLSKKIRTEYWSADIIRSFQESADLRRGLLDLAGSRCDASYRQLLMKYNRILAQRNAALKSKSIRLVELYTQPLIEVSYQFVVMRQRVLSDIFGMVNQWIPFFFGDQIVPLEANLVLKHTHPSDYKGVLDRYFSEFRDKELALGYTTAGAHRDDFDVLSGSKSVIRFMSRGINRIVSILVHMSILEKESASGIPVVLLLDDVFVEIAEELRDRLCAFVFSKYQCVYATTEFPRAFDDNDLKIYTISRGILSSHGAIK